MRPLEEFCKVRGINDHMKDAFVTYIKSTYSSSYAIRPGDTLTAMINNMTQEKLEEMWIRFLGEFKQILWTDG